MKIAYSVSNQLKKKNKGTEIWDFKPDYKLKYSPRAKSEIGETKSQDGDNGRKEWIFLLRPSISLAEHYSKFEKAH